MTAPPDPHCRIGRIKRRGNVHLFPGTRSPELPVTHQPHLAVIDHLHSLLERAERGDIQGVAVAHITANASTVSGWAGGEAYCASLMAGGIAMLLQDYTEQHNRQAASQPNSES